MGSTRRRLSLNYRSGTGILPVIHGLEGHATWLCDDCAVMAHEAVKQFGTIDILVASAGIVYGRFFGETRPEDRDSLININIWGFGRAYS